MAKGFPAENHFLKIALQPPPSCFPKPSHSPFSPSLLQTTAQNPQVQSLALDSGRWDQKNKWSLWLLPCRHRPPTAPALHPSTTTEGRRTCQSEKSKRSNPSESVAGILPEARIEKVQSLRKCGRNLARASSQTEGKASCKLRGTGKGGSGPDDPAPQTQRPTEGPRVF